MPHHYAFGSILKSSTPFSVVFQEANPIDKIRLVFSNAAPIEVYESLVSNTLRA